jgi:elongation factor P hydroxylase
MPANLPKAPGTVCGMTQQGTPLVCDESAVCSGCTAPGDCVGDDNECRTRTCEGGVCGTSFTPVNTEVAAQTAGDCKKAVCDGNGAVVEVDDGGDLPPDDGDACTAEVCDAGAPAHPPKADGAACDDGDACTVADTCQVGACTSGAPVVCAALDQCHEQGTCDPATGICDNPTKAEGAACDDGEACTLADTCQAGACTSGAAVVCAAPDQCHEQGTCDPATGICDSPAKADGVACDDGDACTTADTCQAGVCAAGDPPMCAVDETCIDGACLTPCTGTLGLPGPPLMPVGDGPSAIAVDDLNGDGKPDLAVANREGDTVSVLVNQGNGTFAPKVDYAAGLYPTSIAAADLTGDGKPDLAVANDVSDTVSVLVNQGNGTFAPMVAYPAGDGAPSVAAADLTGDGKPDLAVSNYLGGTVNVLVNQGNGTFAPKLDYVAGHFPYSVTAADLAGDGEPDLVVTNYYSATVSVLVATCLP